MQKPPLIFFCQCKNLFFTNCQTSIIFSKIFFCFFLEVIKHFFSIANEQTFIIFGKLQCFRQSLNILGGAFCICNPFKEGCLRLVGKEKGKGRVGAMVTVKPKRECGLCHTILYVAIAVGIENKIFRQFKPYFSFFPYLNNTIEER